MTSTLKSVTGCPSVTGDPASTSNVPALLCSTKPGSSRRHWADLVRQIPGCLCGDNYEQSPDQATYVALKATPAQLR